MAKKADLQSAQTAYDRAMRLARAAEQQGDYPVAIARAIEAWEHLEGMMQFERRFEDAEFKSVPCIDLVLRHAPSILHAQALDELEHLLQTRRAIDRHASDDLATRLLEARETLKRAHRLLDHIERNPGARQSDLRQLLGGDQDEWRGWCERWSDIGLINRESLGGQYYLRLSAGADELTDAKCGACGGIERGSKRSFWGSHVCVACGRTETFVLLSSASAASKED